MRVIVGSLMHETNTFTIGTTSLNDFAPVIGDAIFKDSTWMGRQTAAAGIIDKLRSEQIEVVPTLFGSALPSGTIQRQAYKTMKNEILTRTRRAMPVDGVCLALHGSMYVEGCDDPEGDLLSELRKLVGDEIPITCALDMHATITQAMVDSANALTAYQTAPHVDKYETGERAAELLMKSLKHGTRLRMEWVKFPMLLAGEQSETNEQPMKDLLAMARDKEQQTGISVSYMLGFPWADSPCNAVSVIAVGECSKDEVIKISAAELARKFWERRHDFQFTTEAYPLDEALTRALQDRKRPVIIADSGDNPTAGASEDLTLVVDAVVRRKLKEVLVAVIADAKAYETCAKAGVGAMISLKLGRMTSRPDALPFITQVKVMQIQRAKGMNNAVVDIDGVMVIITDTRCDVYDPTHLEELKLNPADYKIVIVKSGYLSPEYQRIAARKMLALTPGDTAEIFSDLDYQKMKRPIFPLDQDTQWSIK
ncbi:MAG TPA: M81 family metallopeptidase [Bacillota bacterium]